MGHLYTEGGKIKTAKRTHSPRTSFVTTKIIDKTRLENYSPPPTLLALMARAGV